MFIKLKNNEIIVCDAIHFINGNPGKIAYTYYYNYSTLNFSPSVYTLALAQIVGTGKKISFVDLSEISEIFETWYEAEVKDTKIIETHQSSKSEDHPLAYEHYIEINTQLAATEFNSDIEIAFGVAEAICALAEYNSTPVEDDFGDSAFIDAIDQMNEGYGTWDDSF